VIRTPETLPVEAWIEWESRFEILNMLGAASAVLEDHAADGARRGSINWNARAELDRRARMEAEP
jgi:hypothetical protein